MIVLKILLWIGLGSCILYFLALAAAFVWVTAAMAPYVKKDKLLRAYGYQWDSASQYYINNELDVSIPYNWFVQWDYTQLYNYLEGRALEYDRCK